LRGFLSAERNESCFSMTSPIASQDVHRTGGVVFVAAKIDLDHVVAEATEALAVKLNVQLFHTRKRGKRDRRTGSETQEGKHEQEMRLKNWVNKKCCRLNERRTTGCH
jgi:hypothetical protein